MIPEHFRKTLGDKMFENLEYCLTTPPPWRECELLKIRNVGPHVVDKLRNLGGVLREDNEILESNLSNRIKHALNNIGVKTKRQAVEMLASGEIGPKGVVTNYGQKCHEELLKWVAVK